MWKVLLLISSICVLTQSVPIEECKCPNDKYEPKTIEGITKCHRTDGIVDANAIIPCNLPPRPDCKCTPKDGKIITNSYDAEGAWCTITEEGTVSERWLCENKDEWTKFREEVKANENASVVHGIAIKVKEEQN